jgi:phenylalanyl-tRNA synthetase alpha chain
MSDLVKAVQHVAVSELSAASSAAALDQWKAAYLGPKGKIKALLAQVKDVPAAERPMFGAAVNTLLKEMEEQYAAKRESLGLGAETAAVSGPMVDVTEPGVLETRGLGRQHILMRVREELVEVFARMGFAVAEGQELEDDEHNFIKLNIPPGHPAREEIDNFYVDDPHRVSSPRMMRSQTSTVQIRVMEEAVKRDGGKLKTPIKIVAPGRVYRPDTVDATHSFMFHQIEGLCIDRDVTMVELKSTLLHFARAYFGPEAEVRLRPTFFPFTEPSAELDLRIRLRPDQPLRWMEVGGCGMVHPRVLEACGIDPEEWTGYAFGFGIERLTMGKYAIPDIRMLFTNDLRFLRQV